MIRLHIRLSWLDLNFHRWKDFFFALWCLSLYDAKYSVTDIAETILKCSVKYVIVYLDLYIYINYKCRRTKIKLYFKRREKKNKQAKKIGTDEKYN